MTYWNFPRGPATVRLLLDVGEARQIGASALLRGSGLSLAQVDNPEATVSAAQELAVVAAPAEARARRRPAACRWACHTACRRTASWGTD